jgi:hypothetical protein
MIKKGHYRSDGNTIWSDEMDQSKRSTSTHEYDGHQIVFASD